MSEFYVRTLNTYVSYAGLKINLSLNTKKKIKIKFIVSCKPVDLFKIINLTNVNHVLLNMHIKILNYTLQ